VFLLLGCITAGACFDEPRLSGSPCHVVSDEQLAFVTEWKGELTGEVKHGPLRRAPKMSLVTVPSMMFGSYGLG
jgi:hypothetical protein